MADSSIIDEVRQAIENLDYGSVEVIVQNHEVTQISTRIIKKTNLKLSPKVARTTIKKSEGNGINLNFKY